MGMKFVREDFRRPCSTNEEGPCTSTFFHGGEICLGVDGLFVSGAVIFRLLLGGESMLLSSCSPSPFSRFS